MGWSGELLMALGDEECAIILLGAQGAAARMFSIDLTIITINPINKTVCVCSLFSAARMSLRTETSEIGGIDSHTTANLLSLS